VRHVQERLVWLGYGISAANLENERMGESTTAAVKEFQAKFGFRPTGVVGPGTYELLDAIAGKVDRLPQGCLGARTICIDKAQRLVRLVEKGKVVLTLDARFGFVGAETREGTFRIQRKSRDHTSSLYRTWMPFALFFSGGQAVHYSPYFARDGYNGGSHGCVNLRDFGQARWLFDRARVPVVATDEIRPHKGKPARLGGCRAGFQGHALRRKTRVARGGATSRLCPRNAGLSFPGPTSRGSDGATSPVQGRLRPAGPSPTSPRGWCARIAAAAGR
jgi:L,D-transpeptidase catalytic domain/Putative peptidoglycan binding domain